MSLCWPFTECVLNTRYPNVSSNGKSLLQVWIHLRHCVFSILSRLALADALEVMSGKKPTHCAGDGTMSVVVTIVILVVLLFLLHLLYLLSSLLLLLLCLPRYFISWILVVLRTITYRQLRKSRWKKGAESKLSAKKSWLVDRNSTHNGWRQVVWSTKNPRIGM